MKTYPVANGRIWIGCSSLLTLSVVSLLVCRQYRKGTSAKGDAIRIGVVSIRNHPELDYSLSPSPSPSPSPLLVRGLSQAKCRETPTNHKRKWLKHWGRLAELKLKWSTHQLIYIGNTNLCCSQSPMYIQAVQNVLLTCVPRQHSLKC